VTVLSWRIGADALKESSTGALEAKQSGVYRGQQ